MRALVLGGGGLVGRALAAELESRAWPATVATRDLADVLVPESLQRCLDASRPDIVFNCAAFTRVDDCETQRELAMKVNGDGVANVVAAAAGAAARVVHVSSDYVFDGSATRPYDESAEPAPISVYGESKLAGEVAALEADDALVVRTSWIFGETGPSFVQTVLQLLAGAEPVRIVDDQLGCPTYARFLARALADLAAAGARGLVHYRNREPVTWHGFATAIAARVAPDREVTPVTSRDFARPAPRPGYSVLAVDRCEALLGRRVEEWSRGLDRCLEALGVEEVAG